MKVRKVKNFETIVRQYKAMRQKRPDRHINHCVAQKNLISAIEIAAKAIDDRNKRHSHQRRISRLNLDNFSEKLKVKERELKNAKSFDTIMSIMDEIICNGIGELTKYDTATRIGAYLKLSPAKVYLHSGTRVGAKNLLGRLKGRKHLPVSELQTIFHNNDLTASEFEDILCIFKEDLKKPALLTNTQKRQRPC